MVQYGYQPLPTCITLSQITAERVELYRPPPPGYSIPVETVPLPIDESIPYMDNLGWEVQRLWQHCSEGAVGYEIGASTSVAGGSDEKGEARHSQLGLGCGYYSYGVHGRQATR